MKKSISLLLILCMASALGSCSSNDSAAKAETTPPIVTTTAEPTPTPSPTPTPIPACPDQAIIIGGDVVFGLLFDDFYQVNYTNGDSIALEYNYQPRDVIIAVEEWSSSDESVATVSSSGVVTPVGMGECEITLHISDGLSDGTYTSINVIVQDGMINIENYDLPSYDEILINMENVYGADSLSISATTFSNYPAWEGTDYEGAFVYCSNPSDSLYQDISIEESIQATTAKYVVCRNDIFVLMIFENGIELRSDEYEFGILIMDGGFEEAIEIAESMGIHIPTESLDLTVLS